MPCSSDGKSGLRVKRKQVAGSSPVTATKKLKNMTISEKELRDDFARFIRHEAMRANITQKEVIMLIQQDMNNLIKQSNYGTEI